MPQSLSVDEVADAIKKMSPRQREQLLSKMAQMEDLIEDLADIADLRKTDNEPSMPLDDFVKELRAEGHEIPYRDQADSKEAA